MIYYTRIGETTRKLALRDPMDVHEDTADSQPISDVVQFDDEPELHADFSGVANNLFSLIIDHASYEMVIEVSPDERDTYRVTLGGRTYNVKVETERAHRISSLGPLAAHHSGPMTVKAPMPGLVSQVAVVEGQHVESGQRMAILEAMKMENEIRAPRAGVIKSVSVGPGQTVELNRVLFTLD